MSEDIATVVTVTWEPADAEGVVVWHDHIAVPGANGRAVLYGLAPDTDVDFHVVTDRWVSEEHEIRTGSLPAGFPEVTLSEDADLGAPYVLGSWMEGASSGIGLFVLDAAGAVVWYWLPTWGVVPAAHLSRTGRDVLYLESSYDGMADARAVRVSLDGTTRTVIPLPYAHHDIIEIDVPGVQFATIVGELRDIDGQAVVGDGIVEVLDDGTHRQVWSAFDHFEVGPDVGWDFLDYAFGADWVHANGLIYDATDDAYYISLFMLRSVVKVDRATGETLWVFDGSGESFAFTNDDGFGPQHAPEIVDGEVLFFDNSYGTGVSRLVRYALDHEAGTATRTWEWEHPDARYTFVLGDVDTREGGGHLSSWGSYGEIVATDATDAVQWHASLGTGHIVAQVEDFPAFP